MLLSVPDVDAVVAAANIQFPILTSTPGWKSVIVSPSELQMNASLPGPPVRVSTPESPSTASFPAFPCTISFPSFPRTRSSST